jgi:hypothetical protein
MQVFGGGCKGQDSAFFQVMYRWKANREGGIVGTEVSVNQGIGTQDLRMIKA